MKKISVLFAVLFGLGSFNVIADGNHAPLSGPDATEAQKQVIRDAARDACEEKEDDEREECVMDFYANHNLEEEPSCD